MTQRSLLIQSFLTAALLGAGFGAAAFAISLQDAAVLWPKWSLAGFAAAGAALGVFWALSQALLWRAAFSFEFSWGLRAGVESLAPGFLGWLWPLALRLKLPPPHDFPLRNLEILLAAQAILALSLALAFGFARLWKSAALKSMAPHSLALRLGVIAALTYISSGFWVGQWNVTGDAPHYMLMAESLLQDGDLDLADNYRDRDWKKFYDREDLVPQWPARSNGKMYAEHKPGVSTFIVPAYALLGASGARLSMGLLAAFAGGLFFLVGLASGMDRKLALLGYGLLCFSAPWWTHSQIVMAELPGGVCLLVALAAWRGVLPGIWVGLACAALPWISVRYFPVAGLLACMDLFILRKKGLPVALRSLVFAAASLGLALALNASHFGGMSPAQAYEEQKVGWSVLIQPLRIPRYLSGLMLDQENGWLPYNPVFVLAFFGLASLWRRDRGLFWQTLLPSLVYLGPVASFPWWGSAMAPNRYLVCLAPAFALWSVEAWRAWGYRRAFKALAALSFGWAVLLTILPWFIWSLGEGKSRLLGIFAKIARLNLTDLFPAYMPVESTNWSTANILWPILTLVFGFVAYKKLGKRKN